jgi:hypothetical protein
MAVLIGVCSLATDPNGRVHWGLSLDQVKRELHGTERESAAGQCDSAVDHVTVASLMRRCRQHDETALAIMRQWHCWCAGAVNMMRQCCQSCHSGAVDAPVLSTWCDSAGDHATVALLMRRCRQHDATVLSIMRQWRHWRGGALNMMRQRWQSCDSGVIDAPVPWAWRDSAGNHVTVTLMRRCHQHDATVLSMIQQWGRWCAGAVNMMRQRWRSCDSDIVDAPVPSTWCDSAGDHLTVAPLMRRRRQHDAAVQLIMRQWHRWCAGALNMMQQCCRSCDSGAIDVVVLSTWCDSTVDNATVISNHL